MKLSEFREIIIKLKGKILWERIEKTEEFKIYILDDKEKQLKKIKLNAHFIKYIKNPSEEMQLEVVKQDGEAIQYIKNPSEEVKLAAVKQNGYAIEYINNPSEEMQLEAIKRDRTLIRFIKNPTDEVIEELIKNNEIKNLEDFCDCIRLLQFIENDLKEE